MGPQQRARDRLPDRPADEAGHEAVQDAGRANRPGRRRRSALGRPRRGRDITNTTVSVSRMDPKTGRVTRTVRLRGGPGGAPARGRAAHRRRGGCRMGPNPDESSPASTRTPAGSRPTIDTGGGAFTIAAGDEGVWFLGLDDGRCRQDRPSHEPRDPDPGRCGRSVRHRRRGWIGLGRGTRRGRRLADRPWAPADHADDRRGRRRRLRLVRRGGAVGGELRRRRRVAHRSTQQQGHRQDVRRRSAGHRGRVGSAWVSVAGGTTEGSLEVSVRAGGWQPAAPDVLIASDLALPGPD